MISGNRDKPISPILRFFLHFGYFISVTASGFVENLTLLQNLNLTEYPNMRKNQFFYIQIFIRFVNFCYHTVITPSFS